MPCIRNRCAQGKQPCPSPHACAGAPCLFVSSTKTTPATKGAHVVDLEHEPRPRVSPCTHEATTRLMGEDFIAHYCIDCGYQWMTFPQALPASMRGRRALLAAIPVVLLVAGLLVTYFNR